VRWSDHFSIVSEVDETPQISSFEFGPAIVPLIVSVF
jgi:hypothetical protein